MFSKAGMRSLVKQSTYLIKQSILRELDRRGYVLVKKSGYQTLPAHRAGRTLSQTLYSKLDFVEPTLAVEFEAVCAKLQGFLGIPPQQAYAAYCAARDLSRAGVVGDIFDCGEGSAETLAVIAATLARLGDTNRRLVLFDVSGVPAHRAETELTLWGTSHNWLTDGKAASARASRSLPKELFASGYPTAKIEVARYPVDEIDLTRPLCFLGLTTETYEANRAAIRALMPRVVAGGTIAVMGDDGPRVSFPDAFSTRRTPSPTINSNAVSIFHFGRPHRLTALL